MLNENNVVKIPRRGYKLVKSLFGQYEEIPEEWQIFSLTHKDILKLSSGKSISNIQPTGDYPVYGSNGIIGHTTQYNDDDSILIGRVGASGSIHYLDHKAWVTDNVLIAKVSKKLEKEFCVYALSYLNLGRFATKSAQPLLTQAILKIVKIKIPTLQEQQKIASILSGVDALIELTQKTIEKTEKLKKGLMQKLLTRGIGHTKFKKTTLGGIAKFSSGEFLPAKNHNSGNVPIYGGNGITGYHDKELIKYNAIIFGRVGAYCGSVHLSNSKSWITDNAIFIKNLSNQITIVYLYRFLSRLNIRLLAEVSAQPKISQDILNHIKIHFPEDLKEQQKIASILSGVDAVRYHNIIALIILRIKLAIFLILFVWIGVVQISVFQAYAMSLYLHLVAFDVLHVTEFSCDRI